MKEYIEFKIMKKHLVLLLVAIVIACGMGGFYVWSIYHPNIMIGVRDGPTGKQNIKVEAPYVAMSGRYTSKIAALVDLRVRILVSQHESICRHIGDTYKASNIKLELKEKNNKTTLTYSGTVVTMDDKVEKYHNEIVLDFALGAEITN